MKILIAIGSKEFSKPTLNLGMKVAQAFNAKTTIIDVGEKISEFRPAGLSCRTFFSTSEMCFC